MSIVLQHLQPWIAQAVYKTITFDKNNYSDVINGINTSNSQNETSTATSSSQFNGRPRLAQIIDAPITIPNSSHFTNQSTIQKNTSTAATSMKNNQASQKRIPLITRFNIADGRCFMPVYIIEQSKTHQCDADKIATSNNTSNEINSCHRKFIKKGALVSLRNWTVSCNSILFHNIPSSQFEYDSSLPMCLIMDERLHASTNTPTSTPSTQKKYKSGLELVGGEGMSVVGPLLNVHNETDVRRALDAIFDPIVLVRQVLECHNFHLEHAGTNKNILHDTSTVAGVQNSEYYRVRQPFMVMMGSWNDEPVLIGTGVLNDNHIIAKVMNAKMHLNCSAVTNDEKDKGSHDEIQHEGLDRQEEQAQVQEQEQEQDKQVRQTSKESETQESFDYSAKGERAHDDGKMDSNIEDDTKENHLQTSKSQDSIFASIEEMLVSQEEANECKENEHLGTTSLAMQSALDNESNHLVIVDPEVTGVRIDIAESLENKVQSSETHVQKYRNEASKEILSNQQTEEKNDMVVEEVQYKVGAVESYGSETQFNANKKKDSKGEKNNVSSTMNTSQKLPLQEREEENKADQQKKHSSRLQALLPNNIVDHTKVIKKRMAQNSKQTIQEEQQGKIAFSYESETQDLLALVDATSINQKHRLKQINGAILGGGETTVSLANKPVAIVNDNVESIEQPSLSDNDETIIQKGKGTKRKNIEILKQGDQTKRVTNEDQYLSMVLKHKRRTAGTYYKDNKGRFVNKNLPYNISGWLKRNIQR